MLEIIAGWDGQILLWIQESLRAGAADRWMVLWTALGNGGVIWICAAGLMLLFPRTRRAGVLAFTGLLINLLIVNVLLKPLVARARPWLVVEGLKPLLFSDDHHSFPSGHTSAAFAFAAAVSAGMKLRWVKVLVFAAAVLMGISRLYVGVHFPTDVLAGAVIGSLCGLLASVLVRKLSERFPLS